MAKKKDAKGKNARKSAKKDKLPKTLAGVPIPKSLRKPGSSLAGLIASPTGRELAADILIAVAGVLAGNKRTRGTVAQTAADVAQGAAGTARDTTQTITGAVANVVAEAARQILPSPAKGEAHKSASEDGSVVPSVSASEDGSVVPRGSASGDGDVVQRVGGSDDRDAVQPIGASDDEGVVQRVAGDEAGKKPRERARQSRH